MALIEKKIIWENLSWDSFARCLFFFFLLFSFGEAMGHYEQVGNLKLAGSFFQYEFLDNPWLAFFFAIWVVAIFAAGICSMFYLHEWGKESLPSIKRWHTLGRYEFFLYGLNFVAGIFFGSLSML